MLVEIKVFKEVKDAIKVVDSKIYLIEEEGIINKQIKQINKQMYK